MMTVFDLWPITVFGLHLSPPAMIDKLTTELLQNVFERKVLSPSYFSE